MTAAPEPLGYHTANGQSHATPLAGRRGLVEPRESLLHLLLLHAYAVVFDTDLSLPSTARLFRCG